MKHVTLKIGGPHEVILEDFPFILEQATCAYFFSLEALRSSCSQLSPCSALGVPPPLDDERVLFLV